MRGQGYIGVTNIKLAAAVSLEKLLTSRSREQLRPIDLYSDTAMASCASADENQQWDADWASTGRNLAERKLTGYQNLINKDGSYKFYF